MSMELWSSCVGLLKLMCSVEHIASMSWRIQDIILVKKCWKIQGWSRCWSTHKATRCTKSDHVSLGMVNTCPHSFVNSPMIYVCVVSLYEVRYLLMGLQQMKICYSSWRMTSCGDRHRGEMCKTKRSFLKRSYAWCLQWIHEDGAKRDSPIVSMGEYLEKSS